MSGFIVEKYKNKAIAVLDISKTTPEVSLPLLDEAQQNIAALPPKSLLILTDVTDASYNRVSIVAIKDFAARNTPNIKASAIVGIDGMSTVLLKTVINSVNWVIRDFPGRTEAMDWLATHNK